MKNTTREQITILETSEIVTATFLQGKDSYAIVDDYETISIVGRHVTEATGVTYETLAVLGSSTTLRATLAYHALCALYNGNADEDTIGAYVDAIAPKWAA